MWNISTDTDVRIVCTHTLRQLDDNQVGEVWLMARALRSDIGETNKQLRKLFADILRIMA